MDNVTCSNCGEENKISSKYCSKCGFTMPKTLVETTVETFAPNPLVNKNQRNKFLGIIVGILASGLSYWAVQQFIFSQTTFDKVLMKVASEINESCPIMIDEQTRLDNAVALPDNTFQYNYTILNLTKSEIIVDTLKKYIEPNIINNVKTNPDLNFFREKQTTMVYYYRDKNGEFVYKLAITPDMYH